MGELIESFNEASSVLIGFNMITPVAETNAGTIAFAEELVGEEGTAEYGLILVPPEHMKSYTGSNKIDLSHLSPEGIDQYRYAAVRDALKILPETMAVHLDIGTDDAAVMVRAMQGNMSGDTVDLLLEGGDLKSFLMNLKVIVNNADEVEALQLKPDEITRIRDNIDGVISRLETAAALPGYQSALMGEMQSTRPSEMGMTAEQTAKIIAALEDSPLTGGSQLKQGFGNE